LSIGPLEEIPAITQLPVACTLSEPELAKRRAGLFADLARRRPEARWMLELTGPTGTREFLANEVALIAALLWARATLWRSRPAVT
jgi:hypothetical protein